MLKILGPANDNGALCDGLSRRNFLQVGGLGTGLSLAGLLAAEAAQGKLPSAKSVSPLAEPSQDRSTLISAMDQIPFSVRHSS